MSSPSPPRNPSPESSGSASPNFERTETDDVGGQEVSSTPQPDPNIPHSPQPLSSYHPNQPHLSPQPTSPSQCNPDDPNISLAMDPETAHFIQSQGITIAEYIEQQRQLARYKPPETPNIYSKMDQETANVIHSEKMSASDLLRQEQVLDYYNRTKESLPQVPAGTSRNVPNQKDDDFKFLFETSQSEETDNWHTLKLLVYLKRYTGRIFPPQHVNLVRFLRRRRKLKDNYDRFVRLYGKRPLNNHAFASKVDYTMYRMSWFIWGDHVIRSDASTSGPRVDGSDNLDDFREFFDPDAPFVHPDMKYNPYDLEKGNAANDSVVDANATGSYLEQDDPFFDETDGLINDPILDRIRASLISGIDPTPASTRRVSAGGKTLIFKGPKPQAVKMNSGKDIELEADTLPRKKRMSDTLPEAIDDRQSKRRKLSGSPPEHGVNQEVERRLILFTNNENEDDYATLKCLYWYTLIQGTYIFQQGAFVPDFEIGLTRYINQSLGSKITTDRCKKKVMQLRDKFLYFMEMNEGEDLNPAAFSLPIEYHMFEMFKTVWGAFPGRGGSGPVADQGVNVGNPLQGAADNMNVGQGHVADPIPTVVTNVSGAGKAPEAANVKSRADKEFDADMTRAISNSKKEIRDETMLQGAIGSMRDLDMNVDSGSLQDSGEHIPGGTTDPRDVAEPRASADQKDDNMEIDSTNPEHKARCDSKDFQGKK